MSQVVRSMLTQRRLDRFKAGERISLPEILQWLCKVRIYEGSLVMDLVLKERYCSDSCLLRIPDMSMFQ